VGGPSYKSTDERVNILLLGNSGGTHDGPQLTDSIIVASYNLKTSKVTLISIPRDLWVEGAKSKINAVYENGDGHKLQYAEDKIDDLLGFPIHYGVRIDFSGFEKAVDTVGGVDVDVERSFDDYMYPVEGKEDDLCGYTEKEIDITEEQSKQLNIKAGKQKLFLDPQGQIATDSAKLDFGCRYEHLHFDKGLTHMDGETALKYVRSRHALGIEGSDFARSKRQQRVIQAFREKALSLETLANPQKITSLVQTLGNSFETDIPPTAYLDLFGLVKKMDGTNSVVLGQLDDGTSLLINPPPSQYGGGWVLIPPNNDFTIIQKYLSDKINGIESTTSGKLASPSPSPKKK
jgi:polyisoprenyl-teichoic acid--peptidoglycan teichoic acid transferase